MPRFEPDMEKTRATTRIFENGEYEVEVGEPEGMLYVRDDGREIAGVRYPLTMVGRMTADGNIEEEGDWGEAGEDVAPVRLYVHSEKAWPIAKSHVMAFMGYTREEEDVFNEEFVSEHTWHVDGDPESDEEPELGSAWEACEGQHVIFPLEEGMYEGTKTQEHGRPMPVGA